MNTYIFNVARFDRWCADIEIEAENEDEAYKKIYDYLGDKWGEPLKVLYVDYQIDIIDIK